MIITCPNCQTRYQVAANAIGSAGRKVQCAHCRQSWQAVPEIEPRRPKPKLVQTPPEPEEDRMFSAAEEAALDADFADEESRSAQAGRDATDAPAAGAADGDDGDAENRPRPLDEAIRKSRMAAMEKRHKLLSRTLPTGKLRANLRVLAVVLLAALIGGGYAFRNDIVRMQPDLAGLYDLFGLDINVTGLAFENVTTLRRLKDGNDVTEVNGRIRNVTGRAVKVPSVVVSIRDADGASLYSWRFTPAARSLGPGESVEFETRLNAAPQNAHTIRLEFTDGRVD